MNSLLTHNRDANAGIVCEVFLNDIRINQRQAVRGVPPLVIAGIEVTAVGGFASVWVHGALPDHQNLAGPVGAGK